jgi:hypothetical protein
VSKRLLAVLSILALGAMACSGSPTTTSKRDKSSASKGAGEEPDETQEPAGPGPEGSLSTATPEIFAHSATSLFRLDPDTRQVTKVADFSGCDGKIVDIAVDATGNLFASTWVLDSSNVRQGGGLARVDGKTARCTKIADGDVPNSLAFVPAGAIDANAEALVGFNLQKYVRIDVKTGKTSELGSLNPNPFNRWFRSSGDLVSVNGGKTYLTAKEVPKDDPDYGEPIDPNDVLLSIDPKTGKVLSVIGSTEKRDLYGVGFWAGTLYAFSDGGGMFAIDPKTARATVMPTSNSVQGQSFWGAGVTTSAPLSPR